MAVSLLAACAAPRYQPTALRNANDFDPARTSNSIETERRTQSPGPQQDYRVATLFNQQHGAMLQRVRGFNPNLKVSFLHDEGLKLKGRNGEFDVTEINASLWWDTPVDPDSYLKFGGEFRVREFDISGIPAADGDEDLYQSSALLGFGHFLDEKTLLEGQFEPGAYSDYEGSLHGDDWQFYGQAQMTFEQSENLYWRAGLRRDRMFEDVDVYPQLGVIWTFAEEWRLDVLLPHHITLAWNPSAELILDLGLSLQGDRYHRRATSTNGKVRSDWSAQELRVHGGATWRFDDHLSTFGRVGSTIGGDYEFNGPPGGQTSGTPEATIFFEVGFGIEF